MNNPCTKCLVRPACTDSCDNFVNFIKQPSLLRSQIYSVYDSPTDMDFKNIANMLRGFILSGKGYDFE